MKHDYKKLLDDVKWEDISEGGLIYAEGNSVAVNTGDWRTNRPIWKEDACKQCLLCFPVCPDSSIKLEEGKMSGIDYFHCKGCGVCANVCPFDAIDIVTEE